MGQNVTPPSSPSSSHRCLNTPYHPLIQMHQIPGHPTLMQKIVNPSKNTQNRQTPLEQRVEAYNLIVTSNQTQRKRVLDMYDWRRSALPWLVQVVDHCIKREEHVCTQEEYKIVVFTEHVEARLAYFTPVNKKEIEREKSSYLLPSLTLNEGIYVLINALQAYQLLSQQWKVHYPTAWALGINQKAQIKAWINQDWGSNEEAERPIEECLLIEELIAIIEERMEGSFEKILSTRYNYMAYSFATIQNVLAGYTLQYQEGLKTLIQKVSSWQQQQVMDVRRAVDEFKEPVGKRVGSKMSIEKSKKAELQRKRTGYFGNKTQNTPEMMQQSQSFRKVKQANSINNGKMKQEAAVIWNHQPYHCYASQIRPETTTHRPSVQFSIHPLTKTTPVLSKPSSFEEQEIQRIVRFKTEIGPQHPLPTGVICREGRPSHSQLPNHLTHIDTKSWVGSYTTRQKESSIFYPQQNCRHATQSQQSLTIPRRQSDSIRVDEDGQTSLNSITEEFKHLLKSQKQIERDEQQKTDGLEVQQFLELLYSEDGLQENQEEKCFEKATKKMKKISEESEPSYSFDIEHNR